MKPFNLLPPTALFLSRSSLVHATEPSPYGVSLHATIQIAPENVTSFLEWGKQIVAVVTAEPLCHFFELYQSIEDSGVISWVEDWFVLSHFNLRSKEMVANPDQGCHCGVAGQCAATQGVLQGVPRSNRADVHQAKGDEDC